MEENDPFVDGRVIHHDHLVNTCKYRQEGCCRYIYFPRGKNEFYCIKNISEMKEKIDSFASSMKAKGDNCSGLPCDV